MKPVALVVTLLVGYQLVLGGLLPFSTALISEPTDMIDATYTTRWLLAGGLAQIVISVASVAVLGWDAWLAIRRTLPRRLSEWLAVASSPVLILVAVGLAFSQPAARERIDISHSQNQITLSRTGLFGKERGTDVVSFNELEKVEWHVWFGRTGKDPGQASDNVILHLQNARTVTNFGTFGTGSFDVAKAIATSRGLPLDCRASRIAEPDEELKSCPSLY